jgi:hypothetical protein
MKSKKPFGSIDPEKPHAWIVNPSDKGRKAIKNNCKVYLKDGQNFEIELYNPLTESVLADIKVNGSSVSKSGLIIRPGERFYLDCFVDDRKKFVFNTYEVENTEQSKSAIQKNGTVEVYFYKEETVNLKNWPNLFQPIIERYYYYRVYYPWYEPRPCYPNIFLYGTTDTAIKTSDLISNTSNNSYCPSNLISNTSNNSYCSNTNLGNMTFTSNSSYSDNIVSSNLKIETGRIEKGEDSNQQFVSVEMNFQKYYISSVTYQILPESQKPLESKDLVKKSKKQKIKDLESEIAELKKIVEQLTKK